MRTPALSVAQPAAPFGVWATRIERRPLRFFVPDDSPKCMPGGGIIREQRHLGGKNAGLQRAAGMAPDAQRLGTRRELETLPILAARSGRMEFPRSREPENVAPGPEPGH